MKLWMDKATRYFGTGKKTTVSLPQLLKLIDVDGMPGSANQDELASALQQLINQSASPIPSKSVAEHHTPLEIQRRSGDRRRPRRRLDELSSDLGRQESEMLELMDTQIAEQGRSESLDVWPKTTY